MLYTQCSVMYRCHNLLPTCMGCEAQKKAHLLFELNVNYLVSQTFSANILGARNITVRDKLSGASCY
jgi:hypothetical protein